MTGIRRFFAGLFLVRRQELGRLLAMTGLLYLIVTTVGMLRPIKNAFALDGLADSEFYKVYLVSSVVVLFVPIYNWLADRIPWRRLISWVGLFFAGNFVLFRFLYREGSAWFGMAFYGWADLFSAVMVTQLFMAAQLFFNSRDAKRLYPMVIAGASLGAVSGGAITGFMAERVGTPNLLLVGAALVVLFSLTVPYVWAAQVRHQEETASRQRGRKRVPKRRTEKMSAGDLRTILADPHVRLIAAAVLLTVLVKQLVDYQFNTITKESFETLDAVSAFQGKFNAATQWLPLVVLAGLRPVLQRWGVGIVFLILPLFMLGINLGLVAAWSLVLAVVAKAGDASLRYTTERTGREILYIPVADHIKLKAKAYIDMAVEKGLGKMASAGLIFGALAVIDYRRVGWVAAGLSVIWLVVALSVRKEYVRTLAAAIQGRFASLEGVFASIADASTLPIVRQAMASGDPRQTAFALDLLDQIEPAGVRPVVEDLHALLEHAEPSIRARALENLALHPDSIDFDRVRASVSDPDPEVREAAVRALYRARPDDRAATIADLLSSTEAEVRTAALSWLADEDVGEGGLGMVGPQYLEERMEAARGGDADARLEVGLAVAVLPHDRHAADFLEALIDDSDARVAAAAVRSAGILGRRELLPRIIQALGRRGVREAAREALERQGARIVGTLSDYVLDSSVDLSVRRTIPAVLAGIHDQASVAALVRVIERPDTDGLVYRRSLAALNRLRERAADVSIDWPSVAAVLQREVLDAQSYTRARHALERTDDQTPAGALLRRCLGEAWEGARKRVFELLALRYPPGAMRRSHLTLATGDDAAAANALEYLEQLIGHELFRSIEPALLAEANDESASERELFRRLLTGRERWTAACAAGWVAESGRPWARDELQRVRSSSDRELRRVVDSALNGGGNGWQPGVPSEGPEMNLIEKVFLLQRVDLLADARSSDLALLASIADEFDADRGSVLIREDEPADALYVVIRGQVELARSGETVLRAGAGTPFGTWALIDDAPSLIEATAIEESTLLCIRRDDFYELLADHEELVRGLLQGLARRVRNLVA